MNFRYGTNQVRLSGKLIITLVGFTFFGCCSLYLIGVAKGWTLGGPRRSFEHMPAILAQAPCLGDVCIGMVGREVVFIQLSQNELIHDVQDHGGPINFSIKGGISGGVFFAPNEYGEYEVIDRFNLQASGVPLGLVLNALGEPDDLFLMFGCGRGVHIHGQLFYRKKGIQVNVRYPVAMSERAAPVVLDEHVPAGWIWYFDPARYDEWLQRIRESIRETGYFDIAPTVTDDVLANAVQPWPGVGVPITALDLCPR